MHISRVFGIKLYVDLTVAKRVVFLEDDNPKRIHEYKLRDVSRLVSSLILRTCDSAVSSVRFVFRKNQLENFFRSETRTSHLVANSSRISDSIFRKCFHGIVKFHLPLMIKVSLEANSRKQIGYRAIRSRKHPRSTIGIRIPEDGNISYR